MQFLLLLLLCAPGIITRDQWGSQPQPLPESLRQTPRKIVLHHAGVNWKPGDDARRKIVALQAWGQREKGWPDLPYHYLLAPSGEIFEGRDWHYRPESNTQYELDGVLNVQLWGNFEEQTLTQEQLQALVDLLIWLCQERGLTVEALSTHRDQAPGQTTCPGQDVMLHLDLIKGWVAQGLAGQTPRVELRSSGPPPAASPR